MFDIKLSILILFTYFATFGMKVEAGQTLTLIKLKLGTH